MQIDLIRLGDLCIRLKKLNQMDPGHEQTRRIATQLKAQLEEMAGSLRQVVKGGVQPPGDSHLLAVLHPLDTAAFVVADYPGQALHFVEIALQEAIR